MFFSFKLNLTLNPQCFQHNVENTVDYSHVLLRYIGKIGYLSEGPGVPESPVDSAESKLL